MTGPREPSLFEFIDRLDLRLRPTRAVSLSPETLEVVDAVAQQPGRPPRAFVPQFDPNVPYDPRLPDPPIPAQEINMSTYETRAQVERGTVGAGHGRGRPGVAPELGRRDAKPRYEDDALMKKSAADSSPVGDAIGSLDQSVTECHAIVSELARRLEPILRSPEDMNVALQAEEDPELRSPVRGAVVRVRASTWDLKNRISDLIDRLDV